MKLNANVVNILHRLIKIEYYCKTTALRSYLHTYDNWRLSEGKWMWQFLLTSRMTYYRVCPDGEAYFPNNLYGVRWKDRLWKESRIYVAS